MRIHERLTKTETKVHPLIAQILHNRAIKDEEKEVFLSPDFLKHLHDPFLLPDMEKAVSRLIKAVEGNEKIVVFSDYDADGIPGAVMFNDFLNMIGHTDHEIYIPHRHNEGFGLNHEAIESFVKKGATLIITIDCGTADHEEIDRANLGGADVIVIDHHEDTHGLPKALAVVNPKRKDSTYPFPHLCGTGTAFKVIQGVLARNRFGTKDGAEKWLLDMAGIATLSDMVPLTGENRILSKFGLLVLRKSPRQGLRALLSKLKIDQAHLTEDDIGFMITPRINAASRMGVPKDAFDLLSTKSLSESRILAEHLEKINQERKGVVAGMVKEVKKHLKESPKTGAVWVFGNPDWKPSLAGLVANTLSEEFKKVVFVWGRDNGNGIKGSCRSDGVCDVVALMGGVKGVLGEYGGHKMAGGFSVSFDTIHTLEEELNRAYEGGAVGAPLEEEMIDAELTLGDVNNKTLEALETLSPFGMSYEKPVFVFKDVKIVAVKTFGKSKDHLSFVFEDNSGKKVEGISFFSDENSFSVSPGVGKTVSVVANIEKHVYLSRINPRLRVIDIV